METYEEATWSGTEVNPTGGYFTIGLEKIGTPSVINMSPENVHHTTILIVSILKEETLEPCDPAPLSGVTLSTPDHKTYDHLMVVTSYSLYTTVHLSANSAY